jgi:hypothetical protein
MTLTRMGFLKAILLAIIASGSWLIYRAIPVIPPYEEIPEIDTVLFHQGIAIVQTAYCSWEAPKRMVSCTLPEPVGAGDLVVVSIMWTNGNREMQVLEVAHAKVGP